MHLLRLQAPKIPIIPVTATIAPAASNPVEACEL